MAYTRLLTNPEATYKNYFRNIYATYGMAKESNIHNLSSKLKAGYLPEKSYKIYAPKPNGLNRMYTLMSIEDQIVYQAFANKLADQMIQLDSIKKRYKKSVFGNLYSGKNNEFFFKKWDDSYKSYTKSIIKAYNAGNDYIASFDLTACYDSINHNLLKEILRNYHFSEESIRVFITMLEAWSSPSDYVLGVGIPQGPQASGIIAEAVLGEYDKYIEDLQKRYSFKYYRYVDDIRILAKDEKTVRWVLFHLDKKSKELGLFPQASKISVHKVENIAEEVKQISKPLFEDDLDEDEKPLEASGSISDLIKGKSKDTTSLKRYMQYLQPCAKNNKLVLKAINNYPELMNAFVYYIQRYPRLLPATLVSYIKECMLDYTKQYYAGELLKAAVLNLSDKDISSLGFIADRLLKSNKTEHFIIDLLFKEQLYLLLILSGKYKADTYIKKIRKEDNWWIRQQLLSDLIQVKAPDVITKKLVNKAISSVIPDESLCAAMHVVVEPEKYILPNRKNIPSAAQEALKQAGLITRGKYSTSQINKYLEVITDEKWSFKWKDLLKAEHDNVERCVFAAMTYWRTDLTAFVNLWDTIDDRIMSVITIKHTELGGYRLGNIGGSLSSTRLSTHLPKFHCLINEIHMLRLSSYLSHPEIRNTGKYTGPIPYKEKKRIKRLITEGLREIETYW